MYQLREFKHTAHIYLHVCSGKKYRNVLYQHYEPRGCKRASVFSLQISYVTN